MHVLLLLFTTSSIVSIASGRELRDYYYVIRLHFILASNPTLRSSVGDERRDIRVEEKVSLERRMNI